MVGKGKVQATLESPNFVKRAFAWAEWLPPFPELRARFPEWVLGKCLGMPCSQFLVCEWLGVLPLLWGEFLGPKGLAGSPVMEVVVGKRNKVFSRELEGWEKVLGAFQTRD